jgi:hypothetical protein
MPKNIRLNNLKRKQASTRRKAVASRNSGAQKKRVVASRLKRTSKPVARTTRRRATPAIRLAIGIAGALLGRNVVKGAGHPSPPPNQAVHADSRGSKITAYTQQTVSPRGGFSQWRFTQRATTNGPVVFLEQSIPNKGKPKYLKLGLVQNVRLPAETVLKLGLRTPELGKGRVNWRKMDLGLIFVKDGVSAEAHRWAGKDATRYTVEVPAGKSKVDASFMEAGFISEGKAVRMGVSKLEKTLGLDLRGLSTRMGVTAVRERKVKADVSLFLPTKFGGVGLQAFEMPNREKRVAGVLVINF